LFDTDYDGISDIEFIFGLDPLDPADAAGDLDDDGFSNLEEFLLLSWPLAASSVPTIQSDFNVSFETSQIPRNWIINNATQPWTRNCENRYRYEANNKCSLKAGDLSGDQLVSIAETIIYVKAGVLRFNTAHYTGGRFIVLVNNLRVREANSWDFWSTYEINLPEGVHRITFVHQREASETGGVVFIDELDFIEVNDLYSIDATNRFCSDVQRYLAGTEITPNVKVEPDINAFVESKVEPWPEQLSTGTEANTTPLTVHQLTSTYPYANIPGSEFVEILSCKIRRYDGINAIFPTVPIANSQLICSEQNKLTVERVIADLSPAELALVEKDGNGEVLRPLFPAEKGGFVSGWKPNLVWRDANNRLNIQAVRLNAPWATPPGFDAAPDVKGVQYCHLVAPEYVRGLLTGEIAPVDHSGE
jgi:hypothetical protein